MPLWRKESNPGLTPAIGKAGELEAAPQVLAGPTVFFVFAFCISHFVFRVSLLFVLFVLIYLFFIYSAALSPNYVTQCTTN